MDQFRFIKKHRRWIYVISILILFQFYYNLPGYTGVDDIMIFVHRRERLGYYKYPMINSSEIPMSYNASGNTSSYDWFMLHKNAFRNLGAEQMPIYRKDAPSCSLTLSDLGPIYVNQSEVDLSWVEEENPDVKLGGFFAPPRCKARHRVAILVPYRNRPTNLAIFLRHIHPLLQKQQLEYRIFVIEQYGSAEFNKGTLYNIGYLESQRCGNWQCLIFHDVDLIPTHELILYSCPRKPTHMSASVLTDKIHLANDKLFGGVTAMTMDQYSSVNGYSNMYLDWGAEDDDMFIRVQSRRFPVLRYNTSIARYIALPHERNQLGVFRSVLLMYAKKRFRKEGLRTTHYRLFNIINRRLYTHILADGNPSRQIIKTRNQLIKQINNFINGTL